MAKSKPRFRELKGKFVSYLTDEHEMLHPLLREVKRDDELMLAIRDDYINIYYRGGSILKLERVNDSLYTAFFASDRYNKQGLLNPTVPDKIENREDINKWIKAFAELKKIMNSHFNPDRVSEREFQQLIVRENHANDGEYFITDIEFQEKTTGPRPDMLGLHWIGSPQAKTHNFRVAIFEIKIQDGALEGSSGLVDHFEKVKALIADPKRYERLCKVIKSQFKQLGELGLINRDSRFFKCNPLEINLDTKPEVIFILADHDSTDEHLGKELAKLENSENIDLKFDLSSSSDYSLSFDKMLSLEEAKKKVEADMAETKK